MPEYIVDCSGGILCITNVRLLRLENSYGEIIDIMTDTGDIYSINEAIVLAGYGLIDGVEVDMKENGKQYIKSVSKLNNSDSLDNLPLF